MCFQLVHFLEGRGADGRLMPSAEEDVCCGQRPTDCVSQTPVCLISTLLFPELLIPIRICMKHRHPS